MTTSHEPDRASFAADSKAGTRERTGAVTVQFRFIEIVRSLWGAVLLVAPRQVLSRLHGVEVDRKTVVVTRILGARHLVQATLSGVNPSPEVIASGVWVDSVHSLTALGLAVLDRRRARPAITDAVIAAIWALFGLHDLKSANTPPPEHARRRDRLAELILPRLPGGRRLWADAAAARRHHQPDGQSHPAMRGAPSNTPPAPDLKVVG